MENHRYAFWPLPERPVLKWPEAARLAFWVVPNIEHFQMDRVGRAEPGQPDVNAYSEREYGNRVGIWRIAEILDKYGIRASVALNADICRFEPQIIRAGEERGWEWMGHGKTNSQSVVGMDLATEGQLIAEVARTITEASGRPPRGWLGPGRQETAATLDLLAEHGFDYVVDWSADDQPFPVRVKQGRMLCMPYSNISDMIAFAQWGLLPEQQYQLIRDHFDALYEASEHTGTAMCIALHPYLSGRPSRLKWLDKTLEYVTSHRGVWVTTGGGIADWYYRHYYEEALEMAAFPMKD